MIPTRAKHRSADRRPGGLRHVVRGRVFVSAVAVLIAAGTASSASAAIISTDDPTAEEQIATAIVEDAGQTDRRWSDVETMDSLLPERTAVAPETVKPEPAEVPEEEEPVEETTQEPANDDSSDQGTSVQVSGECSDYSGNKAIGCTMTLDRGYGMDQFQCLLNLWERESNWNESAYNSGSGAYGIPQSLPGDKMAANGSDWQTNPATQIDWGLDYIEGRYGDPCGAWSHSESVGWY
ncbi:lytic transglycosylase domain-containing protein [Glycomyces sp. NPDC046736]|uniref:aggregation-promoting factor C-terminal-like domain-containing protein n=1 Tax=Glycomyces sp. NPDC046736 TaxID=3155615 RepID=UPI0033D19544